MANIPTERIAATRALAKFLATSRGRRTMQVNGYTSDMPIIPAHHNETMVSVSARVRQQGADTAVVAVHFPDRDKPLVILAFEKGEPVEDRLPTGGESTIGMVADYIGRAHRTVTISVSQHVTAEAYELAPA